MGGLFKVLPKHPSEGVLLLWRVEQCQAARQALGYWMQPTGWVGGMFDEPEEGDTIGHERGFLQPFGLAPTVGRQKWFYKACCACDPLMLRGRRQCNRGSVTAPGIFF